MLLLILILVPSACGQGGCGTPRCGGGYARQYLPPLQQYPQQQYMETPPAALPRPIQQLPQPQVVDPQIYYTASYVQPTQVLAATGDKDMTTINPELAKIAEYEKYEEKLNQLKAYTETPIIEPPVNISSLTYIRELPGNPNPSIGAQTYLPRPMPYRPHPLLPKGCPVLPPQYIRPMPFMPRGYVTPIPMTPPPQPVPAPLPSYPQQPVYPSYQSYQTYPPQTGYVPRPPPLNDCCGRCGAPCHYNHRKIAAQAKGSKTVNGTVPVRSEGETNKDPRCSSEELKDIMIKGTTRTTTLSKRIIQKVAEEQIGGYFFVVCSREDFSYVARSEVFCQTSKNDIICYAFQHN